jgi:hypothetical protein
MRAPGLTSETWKSNEPILTSVILSEAALGAAKSKDLRLLF